MLQSNTSKAEFLDYLHSSPQNFAVRNHIALVSGMTEAEFEVHKQNLIARSNELETKLAVSKMAKGLGA